MTVHVFPLSERPAWVAVCAAWAFGQWGCQTKDGALTRAMTRFTEGAQTGALPLTFVAETDEKPAGMASLWAKDLDPTLCGFLTPWMASVYVHPFYRGRGVARLLVAAVERAACALDFPTLYLVTEHADTLYAALGYVKKQALVGPHGPAVIMEKALI